MDFFRIIVKEQKDGTMLLRPDWIVGPSDDLMIRGGQFYAIWDEEQGIWSTDISDVARLVDAHLRKYEKKLSKENPHNIYNILTLRSFGSKLWEEFRRFERNSTTNEHQLDTKLTFSNTEVKKKDYVSHRLSYPLLEGTTDAWDELVGVLYSDEERAKIEWAIGAVVSGDSKRIQKFLVFYGPPGSGKSTILNIVQMLFKGYSAVFDARELASNNNSFATAAFKSNPLVAIQHDGDLSKIYDNTKLNSIVAHEEMTINEKFMRPYETRSNAFLFMGTNQPVKISDAKSGIIRRLIDVIPTNETVPHDRYHSLMSQIEFELGAIAYKCLRLYQTFGKDHYSGYKPVGMMLQTDVFYNFVEAHFDIFKQEEGVTLKQAWTLYKEYCEETGIDKPLPQYKFREELRNYFKTFEERSRLNGVNVRNRYSDFKSLYAPIQAVDGIVEAYRIQFFKPDRSLLDDMYPDAIAQYAKESGFPGYKWENVKTKLSELDPKQMHWVKVPEHHIVIDFDLVDEDGEKDLEKNIEEASKWPPTYAEISQSGKGLHLHYIWHGDVHNLALVYDVGIEIKKLVGDQSLRRKLTLCNAMPVAELSSGLPEKEKRVIDNNTIQSEKGLRDLIERNLKKEIHPGTKPSVDFIHKILEEAYESGMSYNLEDMHSRIVTFAAKSSNQAPICLKTVQKMQFAGKHDMPEKDMVDDDSPVVFYDVEVYPNLFVVCWKYDGGEEVVRMVNPDAKEIERLFDLKLVGFNNRRYDNHILYGRFLGYPLLELYKLSQRLIETKGMPVATFGEAYNLSFTDIYDFSSKKQGLKKFQIELGLQHLELDLPWDEPVPEEMWDKVVEYCVNDVTSTEEVFHSRKQDFVARQILSELSGLSVNHTTQNHTARIIFGTDREPQKKFKYTDLSEMFPGYSFNGKESDYNGEIPGEGGYVYAEPGVYTNVSLLDVASMHPTSIELLEAFGPYTDRYSELKSARMAIKHKDYEKAGNMLDGKLKKFLGGSEVDVQTAEELSYALKIVINIVYGLTSAKFPNPFKDNRNVDNIVAKRGALFMIDLKQAVQNEGFTPAHIKTDSIKIPNATPEIIEFVTNFGKDYGYDFENEGTYDRFCLVNDAVYIARSGDTWTAVGAQFQHPYVFKTLFSKETVEFSDLCETKNVTKGTMYLDFEGTEDIKNMVHVGRTGSFVPVTEGGGTLWRVTINTDEPEDSPDRIKKYAVTGTKGYHWIESDMASNREKLDDLFVDMSYFEKLETAARNAIEKYMPFEEFTS